MSRVRVYIACSLDGFIAGPDGDLSWLPGMDGEPEPARTGGLRFEEFIAEVGALLMGRNTYDFVAGYGGEWWYGDRPVLVPTHRPLEPVHPAVRAVSGEIAACVAQAKEAAGGKDVYIDGGDVIRRALDAGLVDEMCITVIPVAIGSGVPLFAGLRQRQRLELVSHEHHGGGMVQLTYRPRKATP